ncbi:MAG: SGNH/GDSL hydrolase family protein [Phycisphaerales bacterium]|nr:SGNH/GDSL hydrolase family protein [Phycisphaerales bacterium]
MAEGQPPPLSHKLAEFAQHLYHPIGPKRLTIVGDSINATQSPNRMIAGYRDAWNISWNGWLVHADSGAADIGYMSAVGVTETDFSVVFNPGNSLYGGQILFSPVRTRETGYAKPPKPARHLADCMMLSTQTSRFPAGDYFSSGHVTARMLIYQDTNMLHTFNIHPMRESSFVGPPVYYMSWGPMNRLVWRDVDLGVGVGSPRVQVYTTPAGKATFTNAMDFTHMALCGVLYRNDIANGVQMSFISIGGSRTVDHALQLKYSDKALGEFFTATGAPTHLVLWLGQNQTAAEANQMLAGSCSIFKSNLRAIIDRYNTVIQQSGAPAPRWLLVAQYKTGYSPAIHQMIAQAQFELSLEDPLISFLNLYTLAGAESFDSASYTTDGVHPNYAGSLFLASAMDDQMRSMVRCTADLDASGFVDLNDMALFTSAFEAGDPLADIDASSFIDTDDLDAFLLAFESGC